MKKDDEKNVARVGGECQPEQPLTASVHETTSTTVTPDHVTNDALALLRELVDVDWCIGYEMTEDMQERIDGIRSRAALLLLGWPA